MSLLILCLPTEGGAPVTPTCTNGRLDVNATVSISGGATEAKQDTQITKLAGGLPDALTGGGGLKVGVVDALPAGTAVIGAIVPTNAAGTALLPAAAALSSTTSNPTTTLVGACLMIYDSNAAQWKRAEGDSSRRLLVVPSALAMSVTGRTSGAPYEFQRGIGFGCTPSFVRVFLHPDASNATRVGAGKSATRFYVLLINKGSAAANTDTPFGADVFPLEADSTAQIDLSGVAESMTSGCQVVISETPHQVLLPATAYGRFTIIGN